MEDQTEFIVLPLIPLRDIVVYPQMVAPLFVGRNKSVSALEFAMNNRLEPTLVSDGPVTENFVKSADLSKLPIPHHYPQDRGRYMSASIIIAERNGQRNVSFHRQFVRDKNHVVKL